MRTYLWSDQCLLAVGGEPLQPGVLVDLSKDVLRRAARCVRHGGTVVVSSTLVVAFAAAADGVVVVLCAIIARREVIVIIRVRNSSVCTCV